MLSKEFESIFDIPGKKITLKQFNIGILIFFNPHFCQTYVAEGAGGGYFNWYDQISDNEVCELHISNFKSV